jgi:hypothetical protein
MINFEKLPQVYPYAGQEPIANSLVNEMRNLKNENVKPFVINLSYGSTNKPCISH